MKSMKTLIKSCLLLVATLCTYQVSIAQITVSGVVTGQDDGEGLIGVNIVLEGTGTGTITDVDGSYSLEVPDESSVIQFSYTGFDSQSITVGNQKIIDVKMGLNNNALEEVVVVGYTTRKRGELTGSVSSVNAETLERTANRDVAKSLSGRIPGLIVSDRGGYPGQTDDVQLLVRGKSTLGNNSPLILIDNIPAGSFNHLSPQDIESISVLKDGAAAIYGARAANGVILITTKRGTSGAPKINFTSSYSRASFSVFPDLMTSEQFAIYENEISERNQTPLRFTDEQIAKYAAGNDPNFPNTNWADLTFADAIGEFRNSISIRGGNESVRYFVSGDQLNQPGIFASGDLGFKQYQLRSNIDMDLHDNFTLGVDVSGRFGQRKQPGVDAGFIYKHIYTNEPTEVGIFPTGEYAFGGENGANPAVMSSSESGFVNQNPSNLRARISGDLDLGWLAEGLSINSFAGIRKVNTNTKSWYTPWTVYTKLEGSDELIPQPGFSQDGNLRILRENAYEFNELMLNGTIRYTRSFGQHNLSSFVGSERFTSNERSFYAERRDFPSSTNPELFAGSDEGQISSGNSSEFARINYFGSLSYDFNKRYFLDVTLRHDGSSNFGPGKRFGTFPGVAAAWALGNEGFMDGTNSWLDALKIRASWAQMGNDRIPGFQYLTRYDFGGPTNAAQPNYYTFGEDGVRLNTYTSANVPNPDITWEVADMKNIGLNFSVLNYKLTGDLNYFYQARENILIRRNESIPDAAGITLPQENLGKVDNFGWEAQLQWTDKIGNVGYSLGANLTKATNEVVYLDEAVDVNPALAREGFPIDSYIVYPTNGIFRDAAEVEATDVKRPGTVEGEPNYVDTNGDGVIDAGDRVRIYSSNVPEFQYGITGGLSYKNFDFNFLFQGQAGAEMLVFFDQSGSKPSHVFNQRWTPDNRDSRYPRAFAQGDAFSGNQNTAEDFQSIDTWLHDASFLRLKEVELGYTFTEEATGFGSVRVFARGLNLLTMFSEVYDLGLDPEAAGYDNFRGSTYPSLKSYVFGVSVGL